MNNVNFNREDLYEYCELKIRMLSREMYKITKKGGLTEEDDRRLDEIDMELDYWNSIYYQEQAEEEYTEDYNE